MMQIVVRITNIFIGVVIDIFVENRAGKQVVEEQAELVKYSKIKSLATILNEYVFLICFSSY
jgi:hypothetical protein